MNIDDLTIGELRQLQGLVGANKNQVQPMVGRRCVCRTYSAGVHIGKIKWQNPEDPTNIVLEDSHRLWKWEGGGLSLSVVASTGIKGGRLNKTGEVELTNVIEKIPTTPEAEATYVKYVEE